VGHFGLRQIGEKTDMEEEARPMDAYGGALKASHSLFAVLTRALAGCRSDAAAAGTTEAWKCVTCRSGLILITGEADRHGGIQGVRNGYGGRSAAQEALLRGCQASGLVSECVRL
jgi:hypothetical protein